MTHNVVEGKKVIPGDQEVPGTQTTPVEGEGPGVGPSDGAEGNYLKLGRFYSYPLIVMCT